MKFILLSGFVLFILWSCTPMVQKRFCRTVDIKPRHHLAEKPHSPGNCYEYLNYAPDTNYLDHFRTKYIRINYHFVNSKDSLWNLPEKEGREWAHEILKATNYALNKNVKALLPDSNNIPVLPIPYRYVLTPKPNDSTDDGIYFHYDDDLYYYIFRGKDNNIYGSEVFDKYGVQKDTVLNIFFMPHHPDSAQSKTYRPNYTGVALGRFIKIAWTFSKQAKLHPWDLRGTINHEVGHIYSLVHAWNGNDGCNDTPQHDINVVSNNLMDYNSGQLSFTPCQIGKIYERMSTPGSQGRRYLQPNWCELNDAHSIVIRDSVHWKSQKDLEGNLTISKFGVLQISCRVSLPKDAKIVVEPGGKLILDNCKIHNACGDTWQGIEIQSQKKIGEGEVLKIGNIFLENIQNPIE